MRPTEILKSEQRIIEQVLTCLERIAGEGLQEGRVPGDAAAEALKFFREFADGCHHKKEEDRLFPLLEARGLPRQGGPTGMMRYEHEEGRALIMTMADALPEAAAGNSTAVREFADAAN